MNLYDLHDDPTSLFGYDKADMEVPVVFWDKYQNNPAELKKREPAIAKSAQYSFLYAANVLKGPFPTGEAAIAKSLDRAYYYAKYVLKGPFPEGETALAKDPEFAYDYARCALHGRFKAGEAAIAKSPVYAILYVRDILKGRWPAIEPLLDQGSLAAYNAIIKNCVQSPKL